MRGQNIMFYEIHENVKSHLIIFVTPSYLVHCVGCFGFNGPFRHYFSLYRAVSQREGEREEKR